MSLAIAKFYRFGDFTVDTGQKVLLWQGKPLPLTPKVFDVLLVLIENSGRIVEADDSTVLLAGRAQGASFEEIWYLGSDGSVECSRNVVPKNR
jgi:DNA-binding response OmpR family regulator